MLITIKEEYVNSKRRQGIVKEIDSLVTAFGKDEKLGEPHIAGLPYVRTVMSGKVKEELNMFLILSLVATALILLFFFRSIQAVIFPLLVIGVAVVWTVGTLGALGYQVSLLSGLIPPIIVVIGIPNCVYLLNKYHHEYLKSENKILALSKVIRKIGIVTLITNCTTAVGFLVLTFADITILREFGIVAGINVFSTFIISVILIPAVFSYLPAPSTKQLKHLEFKALNGLLNWLDRIVNNSRKWVFTTTITLVVVCLWGSWKVHALSDMVDDIPAESKVKQDLRFFEEHLGGVMPLEMVIHLESIEDIKDLEKMQKIAQLEDYLAAEKLVGRPISVLTLVRAANQSFWFDSPEMFALPSPRERLNFGEFLDKSGGGDIKSYQNNHLVDSAQALLRISLKVTDIGSKKMDSLIYQVITPAADSILGVDKEYISYEGHEGFREAPYRITGTTPLFIKGNKYLIHNLRQSLLIAIVLISLIMAALFRNIRMIILSLIPNLVPLAITGALMGYFGIPLKPSTALIFSIAFGISVDDSIHFLAKYRQELFANGFNVKQAVSISIRETGSSMIYTSIVLFFGFIIFTASNFQGTQMLGLLTSTTLFCAMVTNLILLPALLLQFDSGKRKLDSKAFIDTYNKSKDGEDEEEAVEEK
jgi:predicted RND superfamily exporter protein